MTLVLTLVVVSVASAAILWGLALFLQGYLYNEPADRLPLRAAVGGLAVGCFLTFWVYVNTRADRENKFGALHQFSPEGRTEVGGFEAVYKSRRGTEAKEETTAFKKRIGPRGLPEFAATTDAGLFKLNSPVHITTALIVTDGQPAPVRFDAVLKADGWTYDGEKKTFREAGGKRYIEGDEPGVIVAPSGRAMWGAVALNALLFVVLFAVFWPVLRFGPGHAVGLSAVLGLAILLVLMPLLFGLNKAPPAVAVTAPTQQK